MADPLAPSGTPESGLETAPAEDTSTEVGTTVTEETTPAPGQATAPEESAEDSFFDSSTLAPELEPAYKQMQAAFTKKTQALAGDRNKIAEYDRFMSDPAYRQAMIQQFQDQQPAESSEDWQPNTWEDVMSKAEERAYQRFVREVQPTLKDVQSVRRTQIETDLDKHVPEWRQYEDEMTEMLTAHPTLANDPVKLAKLALPEALLESKAMQAALKKLDAKQKGAGVSKGSTAAVPDIGADIPRQKRTFNDAYKIARQKVADTLKVG